MSLFIDLGAEEQGLTLVLVIIYGFYHPGDIVLYGFYIYKDKETCSSMGGGGV